MQFIAHSFDLIMLEVKKPKTCFLSVYKFKVKYRMKKYFIRFSFLSGVRAKLLSLEAVFVISIHLPYYYFEFLFLSHL